MLSRRAPAALAALRSACLLLPFCLLASAPAQAGAQPAAPAGAQAGKAGATLTIVDAEGASHAFTTAELLARPEVETIEVAGDPAYDDPGREYRAIRLAHLFEGLPRGGTDTLVATALDGFVAQLPAARALADDLAAATAWLAIEEPSAPWPDLPGKDVGAGPFYVVWTDPGRTGVRPENWPYQTVRLELKESVATRYPEILLPESVPDDDPARKGQALFVENCFVCHRMNGVGEATLGPDLNLPMNPTEYFRDGILARYIRDPASVRHWPAQEMEPFPPDVLSDADIGALVAYLAHMAAHKARP